MVHLAATLKLTNDVTIMTIQQVFEDSIVVSKIFCIHIDQF